MCEKYISSTHIQKLAHKIQEIRERALFSIISKLDNEFIFDNDLARYRELLTNLFHWFLFEPCTNEEYVLNLIKRILKSETGQILITHCGRHAVTSEVDKIRSYINPQYLSDLDEILNILDSQINKKIVVPPLKSDIPLSYRSDATYREKISPLVGTTASTIEGFVYKGSSLEQQIGLQQTSSRPNSIICSEHPTYRIDDQIKCEHRTEYILKWQPLIETDIHVLESVENSLSNLTQPSALFHSCEFFINVLLHDFPAEIFIQRPSIVKIFYDLLYSCGSTRLSNIILECLYKLTKALQIRINHYNDPCMQNLKTEVLPSIVSSYNTPSSNRNPDRSNPSRGSEKFDPPEEIAILKNNQLTIPDYCFWTINVILKCMSTKQESLSECKPKFNQDGINISLILLDEFINLLCQIMTEHIWNDERNSETLRIFKEFNNSLSLYGDALEYFRLESISLESNLNYRVVYLHLLSTCANWLKRLVPLSKAKLILPKNFKTSITNSLLDVSLGRLYPKIHKCLLQYVESFSSGDIECLKKYKDVVKVCDGLTATVRFLQDDDTLAFPDYINLAKTILHSVEFHKNMEFLWRFINICSEKLYAYWENCEVTDMAEDIILKLLAHRLPIIQEETYKLCHQIVSENIGTKINLSSSGIIGPQVFFLLSPRILTEITMYGLENENVKDYAEDILLYILKCKVIVSEEIWNHCIEALIPSLPFILCYANNSSALGRTIVNLADPDTASTLALPKIVMLKGNVQLLFLKDPYLREEAFSRICWLIASQENSREILPKFNTIYDKALANACYIRKLLDINKIRRSEHFYQPSSLHQVLELLKSPDVEPVIRRSALNQVSVMMEDHLLHDVFLDSNGLKLMTDIMKTALKENDFRDYPDSIIPVISILKSIALYHSSVREELSMKDDVFYYTLRGLFLFFTDDRLTQDASTLLFLLVFRNTIIGSPSRSDFSIPTLIGEKLLVPFLCYNYMEASEHVDEDLYSVIVEDRWSLSSIQVQWNAEIYGGFHELINLEEIDLINKPKIKTEDILRLKSYDLKHIKSSSLHYCIKQYLHIIQNATSHIDVMDSITKLTSYVNLYQISNQFQENQDNQFLSHQWEKSFARFLDILPSSEEDIELLKAVIRFLIVLVPFYKTTEECWISGLLKNPAQILFDLISMENTTDEDTKMLSQEFLKLIKLCVVREHNYLDYYTTESSDIISKPSWSHVIRIISDDLKLNNTQHFYNLAYLDALLYCLVNLTSSLGWSNSKEGSLPKEPIPQLICGLCELLIAFHCGKGPTAAISVMGLSISRNVLLILNHLIAELQNSNVKRWERSFFEDVDGTSISRSFLALWASRDVVLRAAALQVFSSLAISPKAAEEIINDLKYENGNIWELTFAVLIDHTEAGIVRENAALLLANLTNHSFNISCSKSTVSSHVKRDLGCELIHLFEEYDFYNHLEIILTSLFTLNYSCLANFNETKHFKYVESESTSSSGHSSKYHINITTPGFIMALCLFLYSAVDLAPKDISGRLHERGLVKLLFRTICDPCMTVHNTRELALYCNILEMNTNVCALLRKLCTHSPSCIGTVLHTRDCLNVLFTLLNPKIYHTHLSQLVYLRNRLWSEIFNLTAVLLEGFTEEGHKLSPRCVDSLSIISETITEIGTDIFLESLCESISCIGANDLQNSSLLSLISLLRLECYITIDKPSCKLSREHSIENILDTIKTPRTVLMSSFKENIENHEPKKKPSYVSSKSLKSFDRHKLSLLEETYYGKIIQKSSPETIDEIEVSFLENQSDALMAGAEICKILLYLYDISNIKMPKDNVFVKKKALVVSALTGILCVSHEAKMFALKKHLMEIIVKELREFHIKLSLESVDCLRRVQDKKRLCPWLKEIDDLVGLLTNFMLNNEKVKLVATDLNLADVIHKLWIWFTFQSSYIVNVLRMLCVYTFGCTEACHSLPLTSAVAGSGPRKTPSNVSLLHAVISLIVKEMDQVSKTHDLSSLELAFDILHNCCELLECRVLISKGNLFQSIFRLHPAVTKRQVPWENVELLWLEFLQTFTRYPEGQTAVAKINDVLELIMSLTSSCKVVNRQVAMSVLRNLAFYQPNRPRLLSSGDLLSILQSKLMTGTSEEKNIAVVIIWSLAANNQKAKLIFKSAQLDVKLENTIKHSELLGDSEHCLGSEEVKRMYSVLGMLRGNDKVR